MFFTILFVLYLVLGTALDGLAMMLLTVPVLYPTLRAMGFDDIWFGVFLVIQVELAQLSPPIGLNLLAVQSIARDVDMGTITRASLPYAAMLCAALLPALFLPEPRALAPGHHEVTRKGCCAHLRARDARVANSDVRVRFCFRAECSIGRPV